MDTNSGEQTKKSSPVVNFWISEHEESDGNPEVSDSGDYPLALQELVRKIINGKITGTRPSYRAYRRKSQKLPRWKNSESQVDLRDFKKDVEEELRLCASDEESDTDEEDTATWTHSFKTFSGKPFPFNSTSGPTITSTDPLTLFTSVWDKNIMSVIAQETNRYARQMAKLQQKQNIPDDHVLVEWNDTTVEELYIMFALIVFASFSRPSHNYLFGSDAYKLPVYSEIMPLERFVALGRCLHFVDNTKLHESNKLLAKMKPMMDHYNEKFSSMYQPRQFLDVDDSLLLSKKGSEKGIRLYANRLGIRTYELSEVFSGYVLKVLQYPGSDEDITSKDKAQIVLDLVSQYSNKGHIVVTANYFSSLYLTRMLKSKGFDAICEVKKTRKDLPKIIQQLEEDEDNPKLFKLNGNKTRVVSRHCGDISVVAWSEWDITTLSTYHTFEMKPSKHGIRRPAVTLDYVKVKEKITKKDEDLSEYVMIRQPAERWYIRQFKRLLNISLRNIYVIYKCNMKNNACMSQIAFRHKLANQLLDFYGVKELVEKARAKSLVEDADDFESNDSFSTSDFDSDESIDCCIM